MFLTLQNLQKRYPNGIHALDNISVQIGPGMFGLLGPNGAGKSTLMRIIATLQLPDAGSLHFRGIDMLENPMALRRQLGYLPQAFGVYPGETTRSLLNYLAVLKGIASSKVRKQIVAEVLEKTNLTEFQGKKVSDFSGGMKQRFGIAQILLNRPRLIIVDEPTAGLDPSERRRFLNVLRSLGSENTVIFSTHIVEDVRELCHDMAIIDRGKILKHQAPAAAIREIEGCIWQIAVAPDQLSRIESTYQVLSLNYGENNRQFARIFSPDPPGTGFQAVPPTLEDVYFLTLKNA